jgi:Flp pilus assembly protein CpaB
MKGAMGLAIAAGLGIVGAVCNWLYLQRLAQEQETVSFIGVKEGVQLNLGDAFDEEDLEAVPLPANRYGNLVNRAPQWSAVEAVIGLPANRAFAGREILLNSDLTGPALKDLSQTLGPDEVALWVPIDSRTVVAEQINPGDTVSFQVGGPAGPTPIGTQAGPQIIGPFTVLALGTRRESPNIDQASRSRSGSGTSTMTIRVKFTSGELEPNAARLQEAIRLSGNQGMGVLLHARKEES